MSKNDVQNGDCTSVPSSPTFEATSPSAASKGTPIQVPTKRTIADRTPPAVPTNVKRTIAKPGRLRSGKNFLSSAISKAADSDSDVIGIETIEPENLIKSRKASAFEPLSTREIGL
ncbi:hypothetical protein G6F56_013854 [Rhizopus delemar]|nr:hypothetical protein G6F56_013854 [Rhizopus delemar]